MKAQAVRALDVGIIAPLMIWGAWASWDQNRALSGALALAGLATAIYNARNYLRYTTPKEIENG